MRNTMDYGKLTLDELKQGYRYDKESNAYICNYCEQHFEVGQIFSIENRFYVAEHAVSQHIKTIHEGNLLQLLTSETKYNTLTSNQKELLSLFALGVSDKEIAKKLGVTEATIRRQRFNFREKAKQAKLYLAIYEQVFDVKSTADNAIISIHNNAIYVDDRYLITEQEKQHILETSFCSLEPLILKNFSPKEKKKVVILSKIAEQFEKGKQYSEKEVNQILKPIFEDYMTIRRYLIMYGFLERTRDGSKYWLTE
jgi:Trp operon repressor